ncbi:MAG: thioredoxin family protein, partial [Pseudomonadota bacterium]
GRAPIARVLAAVSLLAAVALAVGVAKAPPRAAPAAAIGAALRYESWSPERLAALRAEGRPVFVNFTAAWCVTCQVNDQVALSTRPVADAFARADAVYLKADWTNRDPAIAAALAEHGRVGVPLYLVYGADGADAVVLPQLLTEGLVIEAIETAARR